MITDSQTNFLYLANTLPKKYPHFYERFAQVLKSCKIDFALLPHTKDVWAVDYMPIQTGPERFVRFLYQPSYLTKYKKYKDTFPDVDGICEAIGVDIIKTDIILDGGNVTRWKNKVIMTDRVFEENPAYERKELIRKLHELMEVDHLYFIPVQPGDFTGHADGMIRFLNEHTVIVNDYNREKEWFRRAFEIAVHNTGLDTVTIPYNVYDNKSMDHANGDYMNYLQMKDTVIVPTFGIKEDDEAVKVFEKFFPGRHIRAVHSNEIAYDGGILNCITWNILKAKRLPAPEE
ncbi:MAG: agmatine deiminase family protein [Bacteroidetes bacterium]|nr:agmatine deiminase family protein [Bacteroidota bacterium]